MVRQNAASEARAIIHRPGREPQFPTPLNTMPTPSIVFMKALVGDTTT